MKDQNETSGPARFQMRGCVQHKTNCASRKATEPLFRGFLPHLYVFVVECVLPRIAEFLPPAHDVLPQVQRPGRKHLRRRTIRPAEPVLNDVHDHIRHFSGHERLGLRVRKEVGKIRLQVRPQPSAEKVVE